MHPPLKTRQSRAIVSGSSVSTANKGIKPTIERTFDSALTGSASDRIVIKTVLFIPERQTLGRL